MVVLNIEILDIAVEWSMDMKMIVMVQQTKSCLFGN